MGAGCNKKNKLQSLTKNELSRGPQRCNSFIAMDFTSNYSSSVAFRYSLFLFLKKCKLKLCSLRFLHLCLHAQHCFLHLPHTSKCAVLLPHRTVLILKRTCALSPLFILLQPPELYIFTFPSNYFTWRSKMIYLVHWGMEGHVTYSCSSDMIALVVNNWLLRHQVLSYSGGERVFSLNAEIWGSRTTTFFAPMYV